MRYLILSDIHANHIALDAVLKHAKRQRWDSVLFLGDAVGYYTQAEQVVARLRELAPTISILGNHDDLLLRVIHGLEPNAIREDSVVRDVILRHAECLSQDSISYLETMEKQNVREAWEATHGGLRSQWEYVATLQSAQDNAPFMVTKLCFVGHTHVPKVYASVTLNGEALWRTVPLRGERSTYRIPPNAKVFINPGSVGQPRDGIPLASYAIFDEDARSIDFFRVEYDLMGMQRSVRENSYPEALATRLAVGK